MTHELTQVAAGLVTFVSSRGIKDSDLRARVGVEGLQRSATAIAGLQKRKVQYSN